MGQEILVYREDPLQKTNQGGLDSKPHNKIVKVFPSSNMCRCPVRLFGKYIGLLPSGKSRGKLYLRPKLKKTPIVWYNDQLYGKNKISGTVKTLCKLANLQGKFSNHSLRATSASRMFDNKVPEQVIKEIRGHKSECVHVYKCTSDAMLKTASASIGGNGQVHDVEGDSDNEKIENLVCSDDKQRLKESLSACQMIKNVVKTRIEMCKRNKKGVVSQIAKKLLNFNKMKLAKKQIKGLKSNNKTSDRLVIDLNVNVKYVK